ncbi:uncharacterized protein Gasu_47360 [Galdieria sulphuraria]|uniref:Uncharacterized protein n=1 Tax=Galdieria sulphuraria TaxID=130081 RepID=M2WUV7_GALSU|nr:uncharacterized protein Gasu_47360 [Galdieria sulphuraria]EME27750.1 hypothetical protein Gasu_47360 [Galdieria sulphuraria]|eukprot:XP_005704270.1 hypothetical protein Gasu_47360 [Galdieria sulphuraria]
MSTTTTSSSTIRNEEDIPLQSELLYSVQRLEKRNYGGRQLSPKKMGLNAYKEALKTNRVPCLFFFEGPAIAVAMAGDWTDWHTIPLEKEPISGVWGVILDVPLGTHIYKLVVDFAEEGALQEALTQGWQPTESEFTTNSILESCYLLIEVTSPPAPRGMKRVVSLDSSSRSPITEYTLKSDVWVIAAAWLACLIGIASQTVHAARTADYNTLSNRSLPTNSKVFQTPMPTRNSAIALISSLYLQFTSTFLFYALMVQDYGFIGFLLFIFFVVSMALYMTSTALDGFTTKEFINKYHNVSAYIIGMLISDLLGVVISLTDAILVYVFVWLKRGQVRLRSWSKRVLIYWILAVLSYFLAAVSFSVRAPFVSLENPLKLNGTRIPGAFENHHHGLSYSPEPISNSIVGIVANALGTIVSLLVESFLVLGWFSKESFSKIVAVTFAVMFGIIAMVYVSAAGLDIHSLVQAMQFSKVSLRYSSIQALIALDFLGAAIELVQTVLYIVWKTPKGNL